MYFNNSSGELNATSVQEAFQTIAKYASILQENQPSNSALAGQPQYADQDEMVSRAILTQDGKIALAQSMANPIRRNLDYQGIGRRLLAIDPLGIGVDPKYERDIDVTAVLVSSNGSGPESRVWGDSITVPTFELYSNPTVRIAEVRKRRFNIIDRAVQKARQEIMAQEDANVFSALNVSGEAENTAQDINDSGLLRRDLVALKRQVDQWDLLTTKYFMNIAEYTDILNWGSGGGQGPTGGDLDPVSHREILQTGIYAHIFGADIFVSKIVPVGTVFAAADPEFVGVMPIRSDIEVLPADEPKRLSLGWVVSEEIGICIANARGTAVGRKGIEENP